MTTHQKNMIDLSDVLALMFTCGSCGVSLSLPAFREAKDNRLDKCPTCDEPWLGPKGSVLSTAFADFRVALRKLNGALEQQKTPSSGFVFSLEIQGGHASDDRD